MTQEQFRSLERGDFVHIDGNGQAVVEAVFYQGGQVKMNLQLRGSGEIVEGVPETEADMFQLFTPQQALHVIEVEAA